MRMREYSVPASFFAQSACMKQLFAIVLSACFAACTPGRNTSAGNDLYQQEWPVNIKDGWFSAKTCSYGPYTTSSRKNGLLPDTSIRFVKDPQQSFSFQLTTPRGQLSVQTLRTSRISFSGKDLPAYLGNEKGTAPFYYAVINEAAATPLKRREMILKQPVYLDLNSNRPAGVLRGAGEELVITAHNRFGTVNSYENICYEFRYHHQPVAAVIPGGKPRVWFRKDGMQEETAAVIAAAIGALLLR